MTLEADFRSIVGGLNLGSRQDRVRIRGALQEFFSEQGYTAELGSFQNGVLLLKAAPAERALLRYDMPALRAHLDQSGLGDVVRDVRVHTKTLQAPAKSS